MNKMTAQEIRAKYLAYFEERGHVVIPRAPLVPQDDPTTLFTGSGMQPLVPYLLGAEHPEGKRLVDSQTCFRAEDIDDVGDNRHTTLFEMLGNWSLGDYFKKEQLEWYWKFLIDELGLSPERLYVTVFIGDPEHNLPGDDESAELWKELFSNKGIKAEAVKIGSEAEGYERGIRSDERIFYYEASKNWWSRAGAPKNMPVGEIGGPDSEVFYEFPDVVHDERFGKHCHPNCDCGRFLEIGNSVFMQYKKTDNGFEPLPKRNVDFGGGLERLAAVKLGTSDIFKISLIWPIVQELELLSGKSYDQHSNSMRVVADHMRAVTWLACDGVFPSNKEQGYLSRKFIRRAIRHAFDLGIEQNLSEKVVPVIVDIYGSDFPEVAERKDQILDALMREEKIFRQTLRNGLKEFDKSTSDEITGEVLFRLYDTHGFPIELAQEEAYKRGIKVQDSALADFQKLLEEQRERSRTAGSGVFKGGLADHSEQVTKYHTATHLMYQALKNVLGDHVVQRGSNITAERIRFDFSNPEKVTSDQIKKVEDIVNQKIEEDLPVAWKEVPTKEAFEQGASGAFGDKYGDVVKVYTIGDASNPFSQEICGGPHVEHTGQIGEHGKRFKITKEEASSAGVRRIKAVLI